MKRRKYKSSLKNEHFDACDQVTAYGVFRYISDGFNVFDGLIVMLSSFEIYNGLVHGIQV